MWLEITDIWYKNLVPALHRHAFGVLGTFWAMKAAFCLSWHQGEGSLCLVQWGFVGGDIPFISQKWFGFRYLNESEINSLLSSIYPKLNFIWFPFHIVCLSQVVGYILTTVIFTEESGKARVEAHGTEEWHHLTPIWKL